MLREKRSYQTWERNSEYGGGGTDPPIVSLPPCFLLSSTPRPIVRHLQIAMYGHPTLADLHTENLRNISPHSSFHIISSNSLTRHPPHPKLPHEFRSHTKHV